MGGVCGILGISRSTYYIKRKGKNREEKELEKRVILCFDRNKARYGRIRIRRSLLEEGVRVSEAKIARILRENGREALSGRKPRGRRKAVCAEATRKEPNLVEDKFAVAVPNALWCSDINEVRCKGGKAYTCAIIDVATRRIVGWSIKRHMRKEIVEDAFKFALMKNPRLPEGRVFHTDGGSQFIALSVKQMVEAAGFKKSMSRPGTPNDNQPIESFWRTYELEVGDLSGLNFVEARRQMAAYIELYYNSQRLHSGIDYKIPNDFFVGLSV